jgi:hypothetical protein
MRARSEPPVGQQAQSRDKTRVALEPGGLGGARQIPQPDRVVTRARSEPPVGQQAVPSRLFTKISSGLLAQSR